VHRAADVRSGRCHHSGFDTGSLIFELLSAHRRGSRSIGTLWGKSKALAGVVLELGGLAVAVGTRSLITGIVVRVSRVALDAGEGDQAASSVVGVDQVILDLPYRVPACPTLAHLCP